MKPVFGKKNILVTGGAGFIGSHLCEELVKKHRVICLDNFSSGHERNIDHLLRNPNFEFIKHDLTKPINLAELPELDDFKIKFEGLQEIYNLACPTLPNEFEDRRLETILANSYGVKNALDLAVQYKAKFLQFSSAVVYGPRVRDDFYFREDYLGPVNPIGERSCYDEGKRFAEALVVNYQRQHNIDAKIARIFRTYGPRVRIESGQMIPDFVLAALANSDLIIYGNKDFSTSLCFVSDIVSGVVTLMKSKLAGPINLGTPEVYKLTDIAQKIINLVGSSSRIVFEKPLIFMRPLGIPDITQAKEKLGWLPVVTLATGLEQTVEDLKASKGLLSPHD